MGYITIGSLFSGIGGFELGLERAISNSKTIWQVEQNKYCQGILKKHWPDATIHNDIREVNHENVHPVNIICGGFPCQDISAAGKGAGIEHGTRSSLWGEMYRLIDELRPRVTIMENVPALLWKGRGMHVVMSNLAQIGYDAEWTVISARQFGAPHLRKRVFIVAYPCSFCDRGKHNAKILHDQEWHSKNNKKVFWQNRYTIIRNIHKDNDKRKEIVYPTSKQTEIHEGRQEKFTDSYSITDEKQPPDPFYMETKQFSSSRSCGNDGIQQRNDKNYWEKFPTQSPLRHRDDGLPDRLARLRALGNAIVPQCSEYIGQCIVDSGLLNDLY